MRSDHRRRSQPLVALILSVSSPLLSVSESLMSRLHPHTVSFVELCFLLQCPLLNILQILHEHFYIAQDVVGQGVDDLRTGSWIYVDTVPKHLHDALGLRIDVMREDDVRTGAPLRVDGMFLGGKELFAFGHGSPFVHSYPHSTREGIETGHTPRARRSCEAHGLKVLVCFSP